MKISAINNINYKANLKNNKNTTAPNFKNDVVKISSKNISFGSGFELGLKLKGMLYARKADKILAQARDVRISQYETIDTAYELQKEARKIQDEARWLHSYAKALEYKDEITPDDDIFELADEVETREVRSENNATIIEEYDEDDLLIRKIVIAENEIEFHNYDTDDNQDEVYVMDRTSDRLIKYTKGNKVLTIFEFDDRLQLKKATLGHKETKQGTRADRIFKFENDELCSCELGYSYSNSKGETTKAISFFNSYGLKEHIENVQDLKEITNDVYRKFDTRYTFAPQEKELKTYEQKVEWSCTGGESSEVKFKFLYGELFDVLEDNVKYDDLSAESPKVFRYKDGELVACLLDYNYLDKEFGFCENSASTIYF